MPSFGLIGPSYASENIAVDSEQLVNLYPELIESGNGASAGSKYAYYHTPGFISFCDTGQGSIRALWSGNNRLFALAGTKVMEISSGGGATDSGTVGGSGPGQIIAVPYGDPLGEPGSRSAGLLVYNGETTPTAQNIFFLTGAQAPIPVISGVGIAYIDGYAIALRAGGVPFAGDPTGATTIDQTQINYTLDPLNWEALDYFEKVSTPDALLAVVGPGSFNGGPEELWLMGTKAIEVRYNIGGVGTPFATVHGAFINSGLWAKDSIVAYKNTLVFLSMDDRGMTIVVKMNGYIPVRVSNYAVENAFRGYISAGSDISNAVAYGYQENGHDFYVVTFPTADRQWVLDMSTHMWHQRSSGTSKTSLTAPPAMFHATAFGKHFVGSLTSGVIYQTSLENYQQNGSPILRMRTSPHLNNENRWVFFGDMELYMGGPFGATTRTWTLESSIDQGFTYGTAKSLSVGTGQQSPNRFVWRRLGKSRDRVFRLTSTDNAPFAVIDGFVNFDASTEK